MSPILLLGALLGGGLLLIGRGVAARPVPLDVAMRRALDQRPSSIGAAPPIARAHHHALVRSMTDPLQAGVPSRSLCDLRVLGRTPERHVLDKLTVAVSFGGLSVALVLLFRVVGSGIPVGLAVVAPILAVVGGYFVPDLLLRSQAEAKRRQFRFALSSYLDLVNVLLAGGAGVETALEATAAAGDGWAFEQVRNALLRSRTMRRSPWSALSELGTELGVAELVELAASVQLAGEEGARIRSSLSAKAAALRARQLTQIEADANSASERMGFPTVAMFMGFLALLAYPAIQQIAGS
jgi:pilus assembly protein TadC